MQDKQEPKWLGFEKQVADVLELLGYVVTHDTKVQGGQSDVLATSHRRNRPNIVIECKYHDRPASKVGISEVQLFSARVSNLRMAGEVDLGYLVTNTGFTADARAALAGTPASRYVQLVTYDELIHTVIDADPYLSDYVKEYGKSGADNLYVDLRLVDTTTVPTASDDLNPGDVVTIASDGAKHLVLPRECIVALDEAGALSRSVADEGMAVDALRLLEFLQRCAADRRARRQQCQAHLWACLEAAIRSELDGVACRAVITDMRIVQGREGAEPLRATASLVDRLLGQLAATADEPQSLTYRASRHRATLKKNILRRYSAAAEPTIAELQDRNWSLPPAIQTFLPLLLDALGIEMWRLSVITKTRAEDAKNDPWTYNDEIDNAVRHYSAPGKNRSVALLSHDNADTWIQGFLASPDKNLLILLGDFGAGKTTVLRRLMNTLATKKLAAPADPAVRIPLLLNLRQYNKVPDFAQLVRMFLQDELNGSHISYRPFRKLNDDGRFILLLDAFDEMLTRVTKADRRRCFREIAELVSPRAKVILTGRPNYFPDHDEFRTVLESALRPSTTPSRMPWQVACVQLLDEEQVEDLIGRVAGTNAPMLLSLVRSHPGLVDLARRPVLAAMIAQFGDDLSALQVGDISVRKLYEIYTDRWVRIEEDKGSFRLLLDADKKATFVRYLAMQMHLSGGSSIHYSTLGLEISRFFQLDTADSVDHFSNDIRTCSFLTRSDSGDYRFIHKSFMEYFVATEFERGSLSPFAAKFDKPLTKEMVDFLDPSRVPLVRPCEKTREALHACLRRITTMRHELVAAQDFEGAADNRDWAFQIEKFLTNAEAAVVYDSMREFPKASPASDVNRLIASLVKRASHDFVAVLRDELASLPSVESTLFDRHD